MDDTFPHAAVAPPALVQSEQAAPAQPWSSTLGPWFHTLGIVSLLLLYAFVAHLTHHVPAGSAQGMPMEQRVSDTAHAIAEAPKVPLYLSTMMLSWMLLASVVAGLYHRRAFFVATLRRRFRSRWADVGFGAAIYLGFLSVTSMLVMLFTLVLLARTHAAHAHAATPTAQTQSMHDATSPSTPPSPATQRANDLLEVHQRVERMLHLNRAAVAALAPHTVPELLLWVLLSFTAGFCEEHIFRGYLLGQATVWLRGISISPGLAKVLAVIATSALFGSLHLYEGVGGAVVVGLLGAVFASMTLVLGNLRAVILAHFLQDLIGGLVYYIAHARHAL